MIHKSGGLAGQERESDLSLTEVEVKYAYALKV